MKYATPPFLAALALAAAGAFPVQAEPAPRQSAPMRDAATHDQLSQSLRMAQQRDPVRELGPPVGKTGTDPAQRNTDRDIIKESTILSYRGFLTLVPERAVLHIPGSLAGRIGVEPGAKVQTWQQFHQANRGWIRTVEVTREQALGHAPIPEATAEAISASSAIVVAVYRGGPISVLPLKEPEAGADSGAEAGEAEAEPLSSTAPARQPARR